jgi:hypothetical protein
MKRFTPLLAVFAAGLAAASFATAGPPPGKGNPHNSTGTSTSPSTQCHPMVSLILKGTFTSGAGTSFSMNVTQANKHGRALLGAQTILVDDKTKFRRRGHATLADFLPNDRLNVQVRACKSALSGAAPTAAAPTLLAKRVVGHPAKAGTTTTTTTTASP